MKQQLLLLLGLILIGTLGVAAGIEASKGRWEARRVAHQPAAPSSTQVLVLNTPPPSPVLARPF